ncbi:MAG: efflux RND transporter periplasmic adaptor subunit [Acidobacteriota bacterium]
MRRVALIPLLIILATAACGNDRDKGLIVASGHVEATDVRISTKVVGTVEWFPVEEGDNVSAGQELARLDTVDARLALDVARAERNQAEADLRMKVTGEREEDIKEAAAMVARAEADLDGAQKDLDRMEGLLDSGSGTQKSRDDARTRRDIAASALEAARERLRKLKSGSRPEIIDAARARLSAAEARIAQLEQQIKDAAIRCPVNGVVTEKLVEQGELLSPGTAMVVVTNLTEPWLTVYISETDLGRVRIGQDVDVVTDDGQARKGRVTYIASKAEFTPKNVQTRDERVKLVYKLKIGIENADGLFKPGMPAEARMSAVVADR